MGKLRTIYSAVLAKKLINRGFVVRDIKPNPTNRERTVFLFDDNDAVGRVVDEHTRR